jgi:hypothetical protein
MPDIKIVGKQNIVKHSIDIKQKQHCNVIVLRLGHFETLNALFNDQPLNAMQYNGVIAPNWE